MQTNFDSESKRLQSQAPDRVGIGKNDDNNATRVSCKIAPVALHTTDPSPSSSVSKRLLFVSCSAVRSRLSNEEMALEVANKTNRTSVQVHRCCSPRVMSDTIQFVSGASNKFNLEES